MNHYISSFLIQPVVRQARRFSRPSSEPPFHSQSHVSDAIPVPHNRNPPTTTPEAETEDEQHMSGIQSVISLDDPPPPQESLLSASNPDPQELQEVIQASLDHEELAPAQRQALTAVRDSTQNGPDVDDEMTDNPSYGVPEQFRSATTSMSSTAQSILDRSRTSTDVSMRSRDNSAMDARSRGGSDRSRKGSGMLPADDGMGYMRSRIKQIQGLGIANADKSRMIHELMTEQYSSTQSHLHSLPRLRASSPSAATRSERPLTPSSRNSIENSAELDAPRSISMPELSNPFHITPEDLIPTYYIKRRPTSAGASRRSSEQQLTTLSPDDSEKPLGCKHYKRNIKLQCSACHRWYTCRFCHNEAEDHLLNRRETKNMLCMLCGCAQPAAEECAQCNERGAWYYCGVCKLWDDDTDRSIYHCHDCGICRVGQGLGKDYYHCKVQSRNIPDDVFVLTAFQTCCVCMQISIKDSHRCIERSTDCDCPICGEYMFTSPHTVVFMKCGHSIHHRCYYAHMKTSYRCPICSKSIVNMEIQFRNLERAIEAQPMPSQFQDTKAFVYCNDCFAKTTVKYHWLGCKCAV